MKYVAIILSALEIKNDYPEIADTMKLPS